MTNLILLLSLMCQTPAVPVSDAVTFWPETKSPAPVPVSPDAATVLKPGERCVFGSDVELFYRCIPEGVVKIKRATGPKTYIYTDDKGEDVEKTFNSKFLLSVTPNPALKETTRCQLVICPKGVTDDKKIVVKLIEAQVGSKPPPVDPIPDVLSEQAKRIRDWALAVKSPDRIAEARMIATNYRQSTQVAYADIAAMSKALQLANQSVVADSSEAAWKTAFFVPLQAECKANVKTLADFKAIALQIAIGLEASVK